MLKTSKKNLSSLDGRSYTYLAKKAFHIIEIKSDFSLEGDILVTKLNVTIHLRKKCLYQESLEAKFLVAEEGMEQIEKKINDEECAIGSGIDLSIVPILLYLEIPLSQCETFSAKKDYEVDLDQNENKVSTDIKGYPVSFEYDQEGVLKSIQTKVSFLGKLEAKRQ